MKSQRHKFGTTVIVWTLNLENSKNPLSAASWPVKSDSLNGIGEPCQLLPGFFTIRYVEGQMTQKKSLEKLRRKAEKSLNDMDRVLQRMRKNFKKAFGEKENGKQTEI